MWKRYWPEQELPANQHLIMLNGGQQCCLQLHLPGRYHVPLFCLGCRKATGETVVFLLCCKDPLLCKCCLRNCPFFEQLKHLCWQEYVGSCAELGSASCPTSKELFLSSQNKASATTTLPQKCSVPEQPLLAGFLQPLRGCRARQVISNYTNSNCLFLIKQPWAMRIVNS